jgi:hypothetical protein
LENDVKEYLDTLDYDIGELTYHNVLPEQMIKRLRVLNDPTSLCIRTRADRIAVRRIDPPATFYWEAKTHDGSEWHNMAIEAIPLINHIKEAESKVRCLYVYRDDNLEKPIEVGFWVADMPPINKAIIPNRWNGEEAEYFKEEIGKYLNPRKMIVGTNPKGTGDPFAVINEYYLRALPHWTDLIQELTP